MSKVIIVIDSKEYAKASDIAAALRRNFGCVVVVRDLEVGDYVLSERCAVERKTWADFINSIKDGRVFDQAKRLRDAYKIPILVVEGSLRYALKFTEMHINSIYGALATLARMGISVIPSSSKEDTARILYVLARQEQGEEKRRVTVRTAKKSTTIEELQVALLATLPGIGEARARELLKRFGSPMNAFKNVRLWDKVVKGLSLEDLRKIEKVLYGEEEQGATQGSLLEYVEGSDSGTR
ncbi:MAG: hypothetical protein DRJ40_01920 [Thermoprotei archaeon]|nr:MAG: hypothetical protein DRJ40_01920 [Thermoprotei archaeon]